MPVGSKLNRHVFIMSRWQQGQDFILLTSLVANAFKDILSKLELLQNMFGNLLLHLIELEINSLQFLLKVVAILLHFCEVFL
jgi:hypothetical protein